MNTFNLEKEVLLCEECQNSTLAALFLYGYPFDLGAYYWSY